MRVMVLVLPPINVVGGGEDAFFKACSLGAGKRVNFINCPFVDQDGGESR